MPISSMSFRSALSGIQPWVYEFHTQSPGLNSSCMYTYSDNFCVFQIKLMNKNDQTSSLVTIPVISID